MDGYLIWLIISCLVIGAEMIIGSVYLLAFFAGTLIACIASLLGFSVTAQFATAAVVIIAGVIAAFFSKKRIRKLTKETGCDNLDEGQTVNVTSVSDDGTAKVTYRGTLWTAYSQSGPLTEGSYRIVKIESTRLLLTK
ncbi:MAG: NfeD family protein [Succinivibrio sp.]